MKRGFRKTMNRSLLYAAAVLIALAILAPLAWLIVSSISPRTELASVPPHWLPRSPTLDNYLILLAGKKSSAMVGGTQNFLIALRNNVLVCAGSALAAMLFGLPCAYGLSRFNFRGRSLLRLAVVAIRMVPFGCMIIPFYLLLSRSGLVDTKIGLIIVYQSFSLPFVIWIMSSFFDSLPVEIEESARVEGAGWFMIFSRVALPLSLPGLATTVILAFMVTWEEMFYALILTNSNRAKTLSVAITELSTRYTLDFSLWITAGAIGLLVPFLLAIVFQKYVIRGLTVGAVKG